MLLCIRKGRRSTSLPSGSASIGPHCPCTCLAAVSGCVEQGWMRGRSIAPRGCTRRDGSVALIGHEVRIEGNHGLAGDSYSMRSDERQSGKGAVTDAEHVWLTKPVSTPFFGSSPSLTRQLSARCWVRSSRRRATRASVRSGTSTRPGTLCHSRTWQAVQTEIPWVLFASCEAKRT